MKIHREGYRFIIIATVLWIVIGYLASRYLGSIPWMAGIIDLACFFMWLWVVWFFRVPNRLHIDGENRVMAPADGKIVAIEETYEPEYFKDKRLQVSIFMSPFNVHVNRNPVSGVVSYMRYHPGKYLVAWHPKSSTDNERTTLVISNDRIDILVRQIAGAVARRIMYYVKEGDVVKQNDEFGFIRFGSRVDVFLPVDMKTDVKIGDVVKSGITILAHLSDKG